MSVVDTGHRVLVGAIIVLAATGLVLSGINRPGPETVLYGSVAILLLLVLVWDKP